jgi:hypothetical protein
MPCYRPNCSGRGQEDFCTLSDLSVVFGRCLVLLHATADLDLRRPLHARDGGRKLRRIVGSFGVVGGLVTIAAMYGAAVYWDRRRRP